MVDLGGCYAKAPSVVSRRVNKELILVPVRDNVGDLHYIYTLNEVAARMWMLMDGKRKLNEIVDEIVNEYDAGYEQVAFDLVDLVKQLVAIDGVIDVTAGNEATLSRHS